MAAPPTPTRPNRLDLIIDADGGRLIQSFTSKKIAAPFTFAVGDSRNVGVRVVRPADGQNPDQPWVEIPISTSSFSLAIGVVGGKPTAGTFQIDHTGPVSNSTIDLAYNASASNVQTELNKLTTVQTNGNVTVSSPAAAVYSVLWNTVGAKGTLSVDGNPLFPSSTGYANITRAGAAAVRQVETLHIERDPIAEVNLTATLPSAAVTVSTVTAGVTGSTSEIQDFVLDPVPFDGTYTLMTNMATTNVWTSSLDFNATPAAVQAALIATDTTNLTSNVTVTGTFPKYTVTFAKALGNVKPLVSSTAGLRVPNGRSGILAIGTGKVIENLLGKTSMDATLEVVVTNTASSTEYTAAQAACVIRQDLHTV